MLKVVLFDLDGTLVEQEHAAAQAAVEWAAAYGVTGPEVAARWAAVSQLHYPRYQRRELTFAEQRRARVREFLGLHADDAELDAIFGEYLWRYEAGWRLFDDAVPAVRRVRAAGLQAVIFTNGNSAHQQQKIDRFGLTAEVDRFISAEDLPAGKPDPRAFQQALSLLDIEPDQALMVGDSLTNDVHGALAAGLGAVLLARSGQHADVGVRRIASLDELVW
ncbi:HAD family hydrolase [Kribbella antibiotica]|uniref:HAD family hydrolase n=1 Tax=Kribbella antibiotica TaxID=190195 RepID=A0A4R4ZR40_9ACTN|nr:HAD family hydrolase [Kribbella antibiotica]TDD59442.1 HAD family hydrolase [Kribbella antibiotica]